MKAKAKKLLTFITMMCVILAVISPMQTQAKTRELYTTLLQKTNDMYEYYLDMDSPVAYKVKLTKNKIVIYGSMSDYTEADNISKHTYKIAKNVKFVSRGGDAPDQKMSKNEFKEYLKEVNDSGLALVLEFKNNKVTCAAISS